MDKRSHSSDGQGRKKKDVMMGVTIPSDDNTREKENEKKSQEKM